MSHDFIINSLYTRVVQYFIRVIFVCILNINRASLLLLY